VRTAGGSVPWLAKFFGTVLILGLPLTALFLVQPHLPSLAGAADYAVVFGLPTAGVQLGLIVRRWGRIIVWRLFFDTGLAAVLGIISFFVVQLAIQRGGGSVDPSVLAIITAYLLAVWSGQP